MTQNGGGGKMNGCSVGVDGNSQSLTVTVYFSTTESIG